MRDYITLRCQIYLFTPLIKAPPTRDLPHPYRSLGGKGSGDSSKNITMIFEVKTFPKIFDSVGVRMIHQS